MGPEKVGNVSAAAENSAEDFFSGHYSISPRHPSHGVREWGLKISKKKNKQVGRAVLCAPRVRRPQEWSPYPIACASGEERDGAE